jgi:hypothetical protein
LARGPSPWGAPMITFRCPQCAHRYGVPDARGGKTMVCSECGHSLKVPFESTKDVPPPPQTSRAPRALLATLTTLALVAVVLVWWLVRH